MKTYAVFDPNSLGSSGSDLAIENGGIVLTTDAAPLDINRTARLTLPQSEDSHLAEFYFYGEGTLTNRASVGIITQYASLGTYVGGDSEGIGYRVAEGQIHVNGVSVATVTAGAIGDIVSVTLDIDDTESPQVAFYLNGVLLHSQDMPGGTPLDTLYLGVSIGSEIDAGDIKCALNAGRDAFEYPLSGYTGWWQSPTIGGRIRIADTDFVSTPTDQPANTRWASGITIADVVIDRAVHFWPWGDDNAARGASVTITFTDGDGLFDSALAGSYRDQPLQIVNMPSGASLGDGTAGSQESVGDFVVERIDATDHLTRRIVARDKLAELEKPLQKRRIRLDAAPDAAGRPWPTTIGACFSVPVVLIDDINYVYAIDSLGATGVGKVRDSGDPLLGTGSNADYYITGGQTVTLLSPPSGIVTLDASVTGSAYVIPPGDPVIDAANGDGNPFAGTIGNVPTNWTASGTGTPAELIADSKVAFPVDATNASYLTHDTGQLEFGKSYRYEITIYQTPSVALGYSNFGLKLGETPYYGWLRFRLTAVPDEVLLTGPDSASEILYTLPHTFAGTYTPPVTAPVIMGFYTTAGVSSEACIVGTLKLEEIVEIDETAPDDEVEDALAPLPLADMLEQILEVRGGLTSSFWARTDAEGIDTDSGYRGIGFHATEQVTIREAVDACLDSYTASVFLDRYGTMRVLRLVAPEDEPTTVASLSEVDLITPPLPRWDEGRGLSRSLGARRNEIVLRDGDLVTDQIDVTMRLRRKLGRQHRFICTTGAQFAVGYEHAEAAEPLDSRLTDRVDGQSEIDRIGTIYSQSRAFYGPCRIANRLDLEIGDVVTLTYNGFGLSNGRKLLVVAIREFRLSGISEVTFWGLAPGT